MPTGRNNAIAISLLIHVLVIVLIAKTTVTPSLKENVKPTPVKSYLYQPPKQRQAPIQETPLDNPAVVENTTIPPEVVPAPQEKPPVIQEKPTSETQTSNEPPALNTAKAIGNKSPTPNEILNTNIKPTESSSTPAAVNANNTNAWQMLKALNDEKNNAFFQSQERNKSKPNSGSIMHGTPTLVPHSTDKPTQDEIVKATSQYRGNGETITKNDNGTCTVSNDLANVNIEGVTAVQSFRCGTTKMQSAFREHMAKFRTKMGQSF